MQNKYLILVFTLFIISCTKKNSSNQSYEKAYYKFEEKDIPSIIYPILNKQLTFKNNLNEYKYFVPVEDTTIYKKLYGDGMGFFSTYAAEYYYYDRKTIRYCTFPDSSEFEIVLTKQPINDDLAKQDPYHHYPDYIDVRIPYFPYWNGIDSVFTNQAININLNNYSTLKINNKEYNQVVTIISNNNKILNSYNKLKKVNVIYYQNGFGIIGFDEIGGVEWRIQE